MKKPKTLNLKLKTIIIPYSPPKKVDFKIKIRKPIFDINPIVAKELNTTQDEYRKKMNTKKGYKILLKIDKHESYQ